ncbi:MAG: hypothetical protein AB7T10_07060 [bacterium]
MENPKERTTATSRAKISPHTPFFNITQTLRGQWSPLGLLLGVLLAVSLSANSSPSDATSYIGYSDNDGNGVNDIYADANGDGINDLVNAKIFLNIKFEDKDEDGKNDLFVDEDGDGVNDLYIISKKMAVIDNDNDGKNDITGVKYKKGFYSGSSFGLAIEEKGFWLDDFKDENGDFCDDLIKKELSESRTDIFTDEDGDGICDNRESSINRRQYRTVFKKELKERRGK